VFIDRDNSDTPKLADVAAKKIKEMIVSGELKFGAPLAELKLADHLGMSRTPIREAVSMLEFEGILRAIPGRGAIVMDIAKEDFTEINDIRIALEPLAAASSMNVIPRAVILAEKAKWEGFLGDVGFGKDIPTKELTDADSRLHSIFIENCGNRRLKNILQAFQFQAKRYIFTHWDTKAFMRETISQHLEILAGLEAFDEEMVKAAIKKHLEYNNKFIDIYAGHGRES
jgi:DNA-binding GntR family transcriptional regulator